MYHSTSFVLFFIPKGFSGITIETASHCHGSQHMEYVLEVMFWIFGNFDRCWKYSKHLDVF